MMAVLYRLRLYLIGRPRHILKEVLFKKSPKVMISIILTVARRCLMLYLAPTVLLHISTLLQKWDHQGYSVFIIETSSDSVD